MWNFVEHGNNIAMIEENGKTLTYNELKKECEELVAVIGRRCLVFCMCQNMIGSVIGYLAFINSKIVQVLLNSHMEEEQLKALIETYCPEYLWMPKNMVSDFLV